MPRLRTTAALSVLALALGIAGTGWLSSLSAGWSGPPARLAVLHAPAARHALPSSRRRQGPFSVLSSHRVMAASASGDAQATAIAPSPQLVPLAMPADTSQSWDELRGHLDGRVVLHVEVDGSGRVDSAGLVESSGDPILDAHALRSVRSWRFAVPEDHPDGIGGELPMRFSARGERLAQLP